MEEQGHDDLFAVTASKESPLVNICTPDKSVILPCHKERAVPATTTVMAQALLLHAAIRDEKQFTPDVMRKLSDHLNDVFHDVEVPDEMVEAMARAPNIRLIGPANGALKEINLKFTEACSPKGHRVSVHDYDHTAAIHGPNQSFRSYGKKDVALVFDAPVEYKDSITNGLSSAGVEAYKVNPKHFEDPEFRGYSQLAVGWNLMLRLAYLKRIPGTELDTPSRLTKVVNAVEPS